MNWLALFGTVAGKLADAIKARETAKTDSERMAADVQIAALQAKLARGDNPMVQVGLGIVALSMCSHAASVAFVSMFPALGWAVDALPAVYAEMQKAIIVSGFGIVAVGKFFR